MQTSAKSSTGHDTVDPGYDTDDHQFTYRHPKPRQPSQRAEHAHYVNGHSCHDEQLLVIFQPKWTAMYP
jgi:hypothetical protein